MSKMPQKDSWKLPELLLRNGYPDFLALNSWQTLSSALVPRLSSLQALAEEETNRLSSKPGSIIEKRDGLFTVLLGDPRVLYYELLEDPSRFEEGVSDLIQQLVSGARSLESLSTDEMQLLDRAVVDWTRPRHRTSASSQPSLESNVSQPAVEYLSREEAVADPEVDLEYREDGQHVPILEGTATPEIPTEAPSTFWWRTT